MRVKFITQNRPAGFNEMNYQSDKILYDQELDVTNLDVQMEAVKSRFDEKEVVSYTIEFNEKVKVCATHNIENIKPSMVKQLTIKIKE